MMNRMRKNGTFGVACLVGLGFTGMSFAMGPQINISEYSIASNTTYGWNQRDADQGIIKITISEARHRNIASADPIIVWAIENQDKNRNTKIAIPISEFAAILNAGNSNPIPPWRNGQEAQIPSFNRMINSIKGSKIISQGDKNAAYNLIQQSSGIIAEWIEAIELKNGAIRGADAAIQIARFAHKANNKGWTINRRIGWVFQNIIQNEPDAMAAFNRIIARRNAR
jgi:hypothetical protein